MKKLMALAAIAALGTAALGGCGSKSADTNGQSEATAETMKGSWVLESGHGPSGPIEPVAGNSVELSVDDQGMVSGTVGCNSLGGPMKVEDGRLEIGPLATTLMACDEDLMNVEAGYIDALGAVSAGEVKGDQLTLTGTDTELKFKRSN